MHVSHLRHNFVSQILGGTIPQHGYEEFGSAYGKGIGIVIENWLDLKEKVTYQPNSFDVITCLGNSLTYLFREKEHKKTLSAFYEILKPGGTLLIDQRNYDAIVQNHFVPVGKVYNYDGVSLTFPYASRTAVRLHLELSQKSKSYDLVLHPFLADELPHLVQGAGFCITDVFHDFEKVNSITATENKAIANQNSAKSVEFIEYVARKPCL